MRERAYFAPDVKRSLCFSSLSPHRHFFLGSSLGFLSAKLVQERGYFGTFVMASNLYSRKREKSLIELRMNFLSAEKVASIKNSRKETRPQLFRNLTVLKRE